RRVAAALELPTATPRVPDALARLGAAGMERVLADPLLSRSQLDMLTRGLPGDPEHAEAALGLQPRALTAARIREVAATVPDLLPSVRLVTSAEHRRWLHDRAAALRGWPLVLALALVLMLALPSVLPGVWTRMAVVDGGLAVLLLAGWRRALGPLVRPKLAPIGLGLGVAAGCYLGAVLVMAALRAAAPGLAIQVTEVYGWSALEPLPV